MKLFLDCAPCMLRQALEASRIVTDDIEIQEKVIEETIRLLLNYKSYRNSPDLARDIHQIIKTHTGNMDPYSQIKENDLEAAISIYPYLKEYLNYKDDKGYWALKIAATGNNIDAAVYKDINLTKCIEMELDKKFSICDIEILKAS